MSASGPMRYPTLAAVIVCGFFAMGAEWASCDDTTNVPSISGEASEAGGARYTCQSNLRNKWSIWVRGPLVPTQTLPVSEGAVLTDWCYYTSGRNGIRSRASTSYAACQLPVGGCSIGADYWYSSDCDGNPPTNCLTRREQQTVVSAGIFGELVNASLWRCVGTRIYGSGEHSRNIVHGRCSGSNVAARTVRAENKTLEDFVSPRVAREIRSACFDPLAQAAKGLRDWPTGYCKRKLLTVYRSFSPAKRAQVREYFEAH
jgi:transposase